MSETTREFKEHVVRQRELLKTLGDEIRVKIHLAGMEAKEAWADLSREAEKLSREVTADAIEAIDSLAERMKRLARRLEEEGRDASPPRSDG